MIPFRHICLLAAVAGVLAYKDLGPALFFFLFLIILEPRKSLSFTGVVLLLVSFFLGFGYGELRKPVPAHEPLWLKENLDKQERDPYGRVRAMAIPIKGTVSKVTPLPNKRIRFLLHNATKATGIESNISKISLTQTNSTLYQNTPYSGDILVTLYTNSTTSPIQGQHFYGDLRLGKVRALRNLGTWDTKDYWNNKGIWIKAFTGSSYGLSKKRNNEGTPQEMFSGSGDTLAITHGKVKESFIRALQKAGKMSGKDSILSTSYAMFPALIFGDRSYFSPEQSDAIARSSLAHSLALSGLHLGYAVTIAMILASLFGKAYPLLYSRFPRPYLTVFVAIPFVLGYVWLGGAPISLLRATCMFFTWGLLVLAKKPRATIDSLIIAVAALVAIDPSSIFDISLQLSALSVAVIALTFSHVNTFANTLVVAMQQPSKKQISFYQKVAGGVIKLLSISLLVQIVTGPLILKTFGNLALWFPLNLLWLPVLGAFVMPLAFLSLFLAILGYTSASSICLYVGNFACNGLMQLLDYMDSIHILAAPAMLRPHWISIAGWWIVCLSVTLLLSSKDKKKGPKHQQLLTSSAMVSPCAVSHVFKKRSTYLYSTLLVGVLFFVIPIGWGWFSYATQPVGIRVLDVGQGQSVLIEWPNGRALIDGGGFQGSSFDVGKAIVSPTLTDNRPARVDYLIHSHPDFDHMSGLMYILEAFTVDHYISNGDSPKGDLLRRWEKALDHKRMTPSTWKAGQIIEISSEVSFEIFWPTPEALTRLNEQKNKNANSASLVLRVLYKGYPLALICGDISSSELKSICKRYGDKLKAEVLILPHHGSKSGFLPEFYEQVKPKIVIASCGWQNKWLFPAQEIINWFTMHHIPVYSTGASGQLGIHWKQPQYPGYLIQEKTYLQ